LSPEAAGFSKTLVFATKLCGVISQRTVLC